VLRRGEHGLDPLTRGFHAAPLVRRRASGLTELHTRELRARGRQVDVEHLHVHLPRVLKAADTSTGASA
jgi:hypothetical protein